MILAEEQDVISNYLDLGFDKQLNKEVDEFYTGVNRTDDYKTSLEMDNAVEGFDIGKMQSNTMKQVMQIGRIKLDGVQGRIEARDKQGRLIVLIGETGGL